MYLPNSDGLNRAPTLPSFWNTIHRIAVTLNLSTDQIAEMMEITPYRMRVLQKFGKEPAVSSAMALSRRINVGFDALVLNEFDYKLMAQQYFGNHRDLPAKYEEYGLAKRRTVMPFLDYIERYFGWTQRALILRKFQLTEAMFTNPDERINVRFAVDLSAYLMGYYKNPGILEHMGWYSARTGRETPFGHELAQSESAAELFERAFTETVPKYFEKNYIWRLTRLDETSCTVEGRPSVELLSAPGAEGLVDFGVCLIRSGFLSSLTNYAGMRSAKVTKIACAARGDDACRYDVQLDAQHAGMTA